MGGGQGGLAAAAQGGSVAQLQSTVVTTDHGPVVSKLSYF